MQNLIFMNREYTRQPVYDIISIVRIRYYTETVIQIFKTYTKTRIRCYIGIISRILTDSYQVNKRKYRLHVFMESLYNEYGKLFKKYIEKFCSAFSRIWTEYGAKKPVFTVVLCSVMEQNISIQEHYKFIL